MTSTVLPALPEYVIKEYEQAARHFCSTMFVNADQPDPEEPPYTLCGSATLRKWLYYSSNSSA